ncbi:hypothetical protein HK101_005222 [Irineochytrium annulatum]|nr:hypothetical protein HK101_005222 [Irineochytrium annulatum]
MAESSVMKCSKDLETWDRVVRRKEDHWRNTERFLRGRFRDDVRHIDGEIRRYLCVGFRPVVEKNRTLYLMAGFMSMQWDVMARCVKAGDVAHPSKLHVSKTSMLIHFTRALHLAIGREAFDGARENMPFPEHVWVLLNKNGRYFVKLIKTMGLSPIEEYVRRRGLRKDGDGGASVYEKRMWDDLHTEKVPDILTKFVVSWPDGVKPYVLPYMTDGR